MFLQNLKPAKIKERYFSDKHDNIVYLVVILQVCILVSATAYFNNPKYAIRDALPEYGIVGYDASMIEVEKIGTRQYRMLHPPTDPETNIVLERWEIRSISVFGVYARAYPMDLVEYKANHVQSAE